MHQARPIQYGSPEYEQEVALRYAVLRKPLGLQFSEEQLKAESADIHLGLFEGEELIACLILSASNEEKTLKMRQVAVGPEKQGQGLGAALVRYSEQYALGEGFTRITLNARDTAVNFYLRLGYTLYGEPFEEVGIPHQKMRKELSA